MVILFGNYGNGWSVINRYSNRNKAVSMYQKLKSKSWYAEFRIVQEQDEKEFIANHSMEEM